MYSFKVTNLCCRLVAIFALVVSPAALAIDDTAGGVLTFSLSGSDAIIDGCIIACVGPIDIPDTVTDGGGTGLTYTVTQIASTAFLGQSLTSVTFSGTHLESIGIDAFAFNNLTTVTLPAGLVTIGDLAFESNPGLTSVTLPASLTTIGLGAFYATALTSITIPENVTTIGGSAFRLAALTSVTFLGDRPTIGLDAFVFNPALTTITYQCSASGWPGAVIPGTAITPTPAGGSCSATAVPVLPLPLLAALAGVLALVGARRLKA